MKLLTLLLITTTLFAENTRESWSFKISPPVTPYATGLLPKSKALGFITMKPSQEFLKQDVELPNKFELSQLTELSPIKNQGNCGSCVAFATASVIEDMYRLRNITLPTLSPQYQMDCGKQEWRCNGSFFEKTADDYMILKGTAPLSDYPYTARNQSCRGKIDKAFGQIKDYRLISNSPKSIATALYQRYPVAVTVGADGAWQSYGGGTYDGCTWASTNHQIVIVGYDLEGAKFDASGRLPAGVGKWKIRNSWGQGWGENGYMWSKMTSRTGRLCNSLAEEAGIVEIDVPVPPSPTVSPTPSPTPTPEPSTKMPLWAWIVIGVLGAAVLVLLILSMFSRVG